MKPNGITPETTYHQKIQQLEADRKHIQTKMYVYIGIGLFLCLFIMLLAGNTTGNLQTAMIVSMLVVAAAYYYFFLRKIMYQVDEIKRTIRTTVIYQHIAKVDPHIVYDASGFIPAGNFVMSGAFNKLPYTYHGGNNFSIPQKDFSVEFSEIDVTYSDNNNNQSGPLFKGLFFLFSCQQAFTHGHTFIIPITRLGILEFISEYIESVKYKGYTRIESKNENFHKDFSILSNHKKEAEILISPEFEHFLAELKKQYNEEIRVSFFSHNAYLFISTSRSYFDLSIEQELNKDDLQQSFLDDLTECTRIVHQMASFIRKN